MIEIAIIGTAILGVVFFAGLAFRLSLRMLRAVAGLVGWPLRGLLTAAGLPPKTDEKFRR